MWLIDLIDSKQTSSVGNMACCICVGAQHRVVCVAHHRVWRGSTQAWTRVPVARRPAKCRLAVTSAAGLLLQQFHLLTLRFMQHCLLCSNFAIDLLFTVPPFSPQHTDQFQYVCICVILHLPIVTTTSVFGRSYTCFTPFCLTYWLSTDPCFHCVFR